MSKNVKNTKIIMYFNVKIYIKYIEFYTNI